MEYQPKPDIPWDESLIGYYIYVHEKWYHATKNRFSGMNQTIGTVKSSMVFCTDINLISRKQTKYWPIARDIHHLKLNNMTPGTGGDFLWIANVIWVVFNWRRILEILRYFSSSISVDFIRSPKVTKECVMTTKGTMKKHISTLVHFRHMPDVTWVASWQGIPG